ncbi:hypothetical protein BJX76DRAFT_126484 [Aspergillus varians]
MDDQSISPTTNVGIELGPFPPRQTPISEWIYGQPARYECASCTLCETGKDCPTVLHPFNYEGQTGLRCYKCSACSHEDYNPPKRPKDNKRSRTRKPSVTDVLPMPYKMPARRFYSDNFTWYVFVPVGEECHSLILRYRVALAEMQNAKGTISPNEMDVAEWEKGIVFKVGMKKTTEAKMVFEEAREIIRERLRNNCGLWEMEVELGIWD